MGFFPQGHDGALHADALTGRSLISAEGEIWLPYDIARESTRPPGLRCLDDERVLCATAKTLSVDWSATHSVHILNGMGVALGDNIIGLSVIHELKTRHPKLAIHLHPAAHLSSAVSDLHHLVSPSVAAFQSLPIKLQSIGDDELILDLGDFAYWPEFDALPMVDFFAWALGLDAEQLREETRRNAWLKDLPLPALPAPWADAPYVLFAPHASSPLRAIPERLRVAFVEALAQRHRQPVLGFGPVAHPAYLDISAWSRSTAEFMAWIADANMLVSADSAAVHIAAGFDVPTLAGFVSIDPMLRTAGYPHCMAIDLRHPTLNGLHHTEDPTLLQLAADAWQAMVDTL